MNLKPPTTLQTFAVVYQDSPASLKQGVAPGIVQAEEVFTYGCLALLVVSGPSTPASLHPPEDSWVAGEAI